MSCKQSTVRTGSEHVASTSTKDSRNRQWCPASVFAIEGNIVVMSRRDLMEQKKLAPRRHFSFKREQNISITVVLPVPAIPLSQQTWGELVAVAHERRLTRRETRVPAVQPWRSSWLNSAPEMHPSLSRTAGLDYGVNNEFRMTGETIGNWPLSFIQEISFDTFEILTLFLTVMSNWDAMHVSDQRQLQVRNEISYCGYFYRECYLSYKAFQELAIFSGKHETRCKRAS